MLSASDASSPERKVSSRGASNTHETIQFFFFFFTFSVAESSDQDKFLEFMMAQMHGWVSTLLTWNLNSGELRSGLKMVKES